VTGRGVALRIAVPRRLSDGADDPRIALANDILEDVLALIRAQDLEAVIVDDPDVSGFDGVVLPGGGDVDPLRYGGDGDAEVYDVNPEQDALDFGLAAAAIDAGLPVFGVCRGLQVLNVLYGGSLVEDLAPSSVTHAEADDGCGGTAWAWHAVSVDESSRLGERLGAARIEVASGHHQAVDRLATALRATATADDGIVEGFEHPRLDVFAVQWHPEAVGTPADLAAAPFAVFADAVRARQRV
jgi:putative glutamine amidotransferase